MSGKRLRLVVAAALLLRLTVVLFSAREVADVLRYRKLADHVLDVSWNPYQAPRLYPYPPVWVWAEAGAGWLARHSGLSFPILIKLPVVAADLLIVLLLGRRVGERAAWLYALHPVSLLITGFHGQFDALAALAILLALFAFEDGLRDRSALALALAIGLKSFPVLLLPLFWLLDRAGIKTKVRYALLATLPVTLGLLPYALHDWPAVKRELLGYGGIADFGWIGLLRGVQWLATGVLARSEATHWALSISVAKLLFPAAYAVFLILLWRGRLRLTLAEASLGVTLIFLVGYGALSAQYLLWVVPLGLLKPDRVQAFYAAAATLALTGFYLFLAPGVLLPPEQTLVTRDLAGILWVSGVAVVLATSVAWLGLLLRRGSGR